MLAIATTAFDRFIAIEQGFNNTFPCKWFGAFLAFLHQHSPPLIVSNTTVVYDKRMQYLNKSLF